MPSYMPSPYQPPSMTRHRCTIEELRSDALSDALDTIRRIMNEVPPIRPEVSGTRTVKPNPEYL